MASLFIGTVAGLCFPLLAGGLIGMMMGGGSLFGAGMAGFLGVLLQIALIGGIAWFVMRLFRRPRMATELMGQEGVRSMGHPNLFPNLSAPVVRVNSMTHGRADAGVEASLYGFPDYEIPMPQGPRCSYGGLGSKRLRRALASSRRSPVSCPYSP